MLPNWTAPCLDKSRISWRPIPAQRARPRTACYFVLAALGVLFGYSLSLALAEERSKTTRRLDEALLTPLMTEGVQAIKSGNHDSAVKIFDGIDQKFGEAYANGPRVYCSRGPKETVLYLTKSTTNGESAFTIGPLWCDAIYLKAYSLAELGRRGDAAKELDRALTMAPNNSQYLNERAYLLTKAREFTTAITMFKQSEQDSALTPNPKVANEMKSRACRGIGYALIEIGANPKVANEMKSRACRGIGYALIEIGELDESETNFLRCLTLDPDDQKSRQELVFIAQQKARLARLKALKDRQK